MKKLYFTALLFMGSLCIQAQETKDWADFGRYEAANKEVKNPKVVFHGKLYYRWLARCRP